MKASLKLTFDSGRGEQYTMAIELSEDVASDIEKLPPIADRGPVMDSFEEAIEVLRMKQFRKDLFVGQARNLGALLAERMEDAEGWHDASRIEPARRELKQ